MRERDNPWFKFYPRDWLESTRHLSVEERGAYIDFIAMRMISDGPLPVEDESYKWLAHQMHVSPRKARALTEALIEAKRVLRTEGGITDERCEKELAARAHQRKVNAENAVKSPRNLRETSANSEPNHVENSKKINDNNERVTSSQSESSHTRARIEPEIDKEKRSNTPQPPVPGGDDIGEKFEQFWRAYPPSIRKVAKGECMLLFREAVTGRRRSGGKRSQKVLAFGRINPDELIAAAHRYAAKHPDPDFVPAPATWLNQGRWLDDAGKGAASERLWWEDVEKRAAMTPERWRKGIATYANGVWPVDKLGPPPGDPGCIVPKSIIDELDLTERYTPDGISRIPH